MSKSKDSFNKYLILGAGAVVGGFTVGAIGLTLLDSIRDSQASSNGLNLVSYNAHLKSGVHKVILTNSFYENFADGRSEKYQDFAITCVKKAYEDLNKHITGIKFDIYTENDGLVKYGFKKAESIDLTNDLPIYLSKEPLSGENGKTSAIATTSWQINDVTRELYGEKIVVYNNYVYMIFNASKTWEENFVPSNSYFYAALIHETMHAMGFAHQNNNDSVMYPYSGRNTNHELTEKDIDMLKTYDTTFYKEKYEVPNTTSNYTTDEGMML